MDKNKSISKFLSYVLRHDPASIQLQLDAHGWANVNELLKQAQQHGKRFTLEQLETVVAENDKQRFAFSDDKTRIRANQGHSITVELDLLPVAPPEFLYHGTVGKFVSLIRENGLLKMSRQHVHLTDNRKTAEKVGSRRGVPVILTVRSGEMHRNGIHFFLSENGVWLTDHVPSAYIQ